MFTVWAVLDCFFKQTLNFRSGITDDKKNTACDKVSKIAGHGGNEVNNVKKVSRLHNSLIRRGSSLRYFLHLQKSQWFSGNKLKKTQKRKLGLLLQHAYNDVPYYHKLFKRRHLKPQDIKTMEDLAKIPILRKEDIRNSFRDFLSRNFGAYDPKPRSTSGSTGEPFQYYVGRDTIGIGDAALWRGWSYAGYRFRDRMAVLAGLSLVPRKQRSLFSQLMDMPFYRTIKLPAINIRKENLRLYVSKILEFKPKFIRGYPSSLYFFADFLKEEGADGIRPKAVLTTAEMLFPYQRKLIEEVFNCEVFDGYGSFDGGTAAFECEQHYGYHIAMEKVIMEFVDRDGNPATGEKGRIIATDLYNYVMPFIRYDTGDMGVLSDERCACGRGLALMREILGRTTDLLQFGNGTVLSGPSLTLIFKDFDIKQYQVVQTSDDSMVIKIIKGKGYSIEDSRKIYHILKSAVGKEVEVKFDFVDNIPPTKSGKWRIVIREVNNEGLEYSS